MPWIKGQQTLAVQNQIGHILGLADLAVGFWSTTQFCPCSKKAAIGGT